MKLAYLRMKKIRKWNFKIICINSYPHITVQVLGSRYSLLSLITKKEP